MHNKPELETFIGPHASQRVQQRGVKPSLAKMVITFADREIHVGGSHAFLEGTQK